MPKVKISEYSATANSNTDVASINIDEGCAPSGINNAIRAVMGHLKDFQSGTSNDPFTVGSSGSLTLSYGTANGVAYLNGSKVLTTGSALTWSGTLLSATTSVAGNSNVLSLINSNTAGGGQGVAVSGFSSNGSNSLGSIQFGGAGALGGNLDFYTANSSGTNTLTMRLDTSGDLLVGSTTVPSAGLPNILSANSAGGGIQFAHTGSNGGALMGGIGGGGQFFYTYTGALGSETYTERMRLDGSGNLLLGTTGANTKLTVLGPDDSTAISIINRNTAIGGVGLGFDYVGAQGGTDCGDLVFYTTPNTGGAALTARARIDSSGTLLVSTTSNPLTSTCKFVVYGGTAEYNAAFYNSSATNPFGAVIRYSAAAPNGTGNQFLDCIDTGATRAQIRSDGGLANYSANNVNLSDRREKTNFAPAKSYLAVICAIPVQTFNYIDQNLEDDGGLTLGVVAQDVQAVAPELVMESNWASKDEEPKMRLSIYQTDLQYALMKALQELKAEFDAYKASHP